MGTLKKHIGGNWVPIAPSSESVSMGLNSFVTSEIPAGTINGTNKVFTTANPYISTGISVYVNGLLQSRESGHYVETDPSAGTFTFDEAPIAGDIVSVAYQQALTATGNADTLDGYHASTTPMASTIPVVNGDGDLSVPGDMYSNGSIVSSQYHIGVIPSSTFGSTGNKAITGVGFMPKIVRFKLQIGTGTTTAIYWAEGEATSSSNMRFSAIYSSTSSVRRVGSESYCIGWTNNTTSLMLSTLVSMDPDGFTINVSMANTGFDIAYEAER